MNLDQLKADRDLWRDIAKKIGEDLENNVGFLMAKIEETGFDSPMSPLEKLGIIQGLTRIVHSAQFELGRPALADPDEVSKNPENVMTLDKLKNGGGDE